MRLVERLRQELAQAKRLKASRGLAMLLVVIVLSTLLVVGVLFTATASLDVQASAFYRQAAQAELFALEGLYRAMAELYYDVWGVDESVAFKCADSDDPDTMGIVEGKLADAAYYTTKAPPSLTRDEGGKVTKPWARWRRSTTNLNSERVNQPVLTDLRWMIYGNDGKATQIYVGPYTPPGHFVSGTHSGAPYHDEFLPEFTDNSDVWELGVHVNNGDSFGRIWRNDEEDTGGDWNPGSWCSMSLYWPGRRGFKEYDYVDTRIVGDSFYKIFRFDLIDPATKRSYAAGLDPVTGAYIDPRFTHEGNASSGTYMDNRGDAQNINQVNNNYQWELYWGWDVAALGNAPPADSLQMYHYNESKWIYVYDTEGQNKLGRYAVMVWPDCGGPNANMHYDTAEVRGSTMKATSDYFLSLDWGFTPHGGPIGGMNDPTINNIVSELVEGYEAVDWEDAMGTRIGDYKRAEDVFVDSGGGLISSRAEMNMFIRKACFTQSANASVTGWTHEEAAWDAHIIASLCSVSSYEYLLDHHWANDRLVLDRLGLVPYSTEYTEVTPITSGTSYFSSIDTQMRYAQILDELRYTYGPDNAKEGRHTQYHDPGDPNHPELTERSKMARAAPISWLAHMWYYVRNDFQTMRGKPYGISFDSGASWKGGVTEGEVRSDRHLVVNRTDFPLITEVGTYTFPGQDTGSNPPTVEGYPEPWGWLAKYDPSGASLDNVNDSDARVYFDGQTPKYFVELSKHWGLNYTHVALNLDNNYRLYVNGNDILNRTGSTGSTYCRTTRVIGIDEKGPTQGGQQYAYYCEGNNTVPGSGDWSPKVVPDQDDYIGGSWPSACAGQKLNSVSGVGNHTMAMFAFNKYRKDFGWGQDPWPESWARAHPANYLVITFDGAVDAGSAAMYSTMRAAVAPDSGQTTIVLTWNEYVLDVAHLPTVGATAPATSPLRNYSNVFDCGFDAYDPVNNHAPANWAPNDLVGQFSAYPEPGSVADKNDRASPAWRGVSKTLSGGMPWHDGPTKLGRMDGATGRWLDGLNYHTLMAYLPGGEMAPASKLLHTISDVRDKSGAASTVACGSNVLGSLFTYERMGARDWESLVKAPTGFWPEQNDILSDDVPDPLLRWWNDLMKVTPLEKVITAGYFGNAGDDLSRLGEHMIYDEVDNDMDGHIDNLTSVHIAGGPLGHYLADRKVMGRVNMNELQHPASIFYCGFCNGQFGSQLLFAGRKPLKGYTSWGEVLTRGVYYMQSQYGPKVDEPYDMVFWYENQWGDCSTDHTHNGRMMEYQMSDMKDTSRMLFAGNSPVYTVYVTGQVLHDSKDPIAETKLRATVERTWDGKMNILEFSWIPKDIITEQ